MDNRGFLYTLRRTYQEPFNSRQKEGEVSSFTPEYVPSQHDIKTRSSERVKTADINLLEVNLISGVWEDE